MDLDWRYLWSGLSDRKYLIIFKIRWSTDSCTSGSRSDFNGLDHRQFGLFYSQKTPLSVFRIAGAVMVILGVVLVSMAKENKTASEKLQKSESTTLWIWRAFGILQEC